MQIERLINTIFDEPSDLVDYCTTWATANARFNEFLDTYRDKIRKKYRVGRDDEARASLLAELTVAQWLLTDRRCELLYEPYIASKARGTDFSLVFRANSTLNIEVTRLRGPYPIDANKLGAVVASKLGQLQNSAANMLVLVTPETALSYGEIGAGLRSIEQRLSNGDLQLVQRSGCTTPRELRQLGPRLSGVASITLSVPTPPAQLWLNPAARHRIGDELLRCLRRDK
jgi:hypothetical protein